VSERRLGERGWRLPLSRLAAVIVVMLGLTPSLAVAAGESTPPPQGKGTPAPAARRERTPAPVRRIDGVYGVEGDTATVSVRLLFGAVYHLTSSDIWEGVGILDSTIYRGVFRQRGTTSTPTAATGEHTIDWTDPEHPNVQGTYTSLRSGSFVQHWRRLSDPDKKPVVQPPDDPGSPGHRPKFGEYVYVEELPEVMTKVAPIYPDEGERVSGTVMVQALVLEDGTVGEVRAVDGPPLLMDAAIACVRQWRFKPARAKGAPVAVWVAVPIRFSPQ
jgi:TonB family protein